MNLDCILYWIEQHPGLASWIQAVGSIGAIIGAFAVSAQQLKNIESQRKADAQQRVEALYAVIKNGVENAIAVGELATKAPPDFVFQKAWSMHLGEVIQSALHTMRTMPVHELGSYELVLNYGTILSAISKIQFEAEKYVSNKPSIEQTIETYELLKTQMNIVKVGWDEFQKHAMPLRAPRQV